MRPKALLVSALSLVLGCTTSPERVGESPIVSGGSTTSTAVSGLTTSSVVEGPIRGTLPDGTVYDVFFEPLSRESVLGVSAGLVVEAGDGAGLPLGEVRFIAGPVEGTGWMADNLFRVGADEWTVEFELSGPALSALGVDRESIFDAAVEVSTNLDLPVVDLSSPLAWAPDEVTVMEVRYETFVVRRACDPQAVACNATHAVQVIPLNETSSEVWIESYALRPVSDPHYVDPGPLTARTGHDVIWTGTEMIVWGGRPSAPGVEGAAFDPAANTWRTLPPAPIAGGQATRAGWAGNELIVLSEAATVAFDPETDAWKMVGSGVTAPIEPGHMVWTGTELVAWAPDGIHSLNPTDGLWTELPLPVADAVGVLRVLDDRVYAVGSEGCDSISEWTGDEWLGLPDVPPSARSTACAHPGQIAAIDHRLVVWSDADHPGVAYDPASGHWEEMPGIPLETTESSLGPLLLGDRLLVARGAEGALYDAAADVWTAVELPGHGTDVDMVWSGHEVLMWDKCCYGPSDVDAWRWAPPG